MDELLKLLSETDGVSGNEGAVRDIIKEKAQKYCDVKTDKMGNVIAFKKGNVGAKKIMLAAHMDEVGFIVSYIDDNGFIKFKSVGGIDQRVLLGKRVRIGNGKIIGTIGIKAIHLQTAAERGNVIQQSAMYIDTGAASRDATGVKVGDYIAYDTTFDDFGDGKMKGKALDDRLGCAMLLELMKNDYDDDIYFAFTAQEEVGCRGAGVAAYTIKPDIAIVCECTSCADMPNIEDHMKVTVMGEGPAVSFMDAGTIGDKRLVADIINSAKENSVKYQIKRSAQGGNDGGAINTSREGIPTAVISIPCRYFHSPVSVADKADYKNAIKLIDVYLKKRK